MSFNKKLHGGGAGMYSLGGFCKSDSSGVTNVFRPSAKKPHSLDFKDVGMPWVSSEGAARGLNLVVAVQPQPLSHRAF